MGSGPSETPSNSVTHDSGAQRPLTAGQITFDVVFGVALPVVCLVADPGIFRSGGLMTPMLGGYAAAAYALILPAMGVLAAWLAWRKGALFLAGPLLVCGAVALGIGVVLLPLSLALSLVGIGLLGLVPLGTAVTFLRNGVRAFRAARASHSPPLLWGTATVLGVAAILLPLAAQASVNRRARAVLEAALIGDTKGEAEAVARLKPFGWLADSSGMAAAWSSTSDPVVQERLARVWHEATGQSLAALID